MLFLVCVVGLFLVLGLVAGDPPEPPAEDYEWV